MRKRQKVFITITCLFIITLLSVHATSLSMITSPSTLATTPPSVPPSYLLPLGGSGSLLCGDCDADGRVTILDARLASQYGAGLGKLLEPQFGACNVAGVPGNHYYPQAQVSSIDALTIAQYAIGRIPELNCILDDPYVFNRGFTIFLMDQDGSNQREVQYSGSGGSSNPAMSPDGGNIVFDELVVTSLQLFTIPTDSVAVDLPRQLTFSAAHHSDPVWSPNGREIAYMRQSNFPFWDLYVLDVATLQERNLVNGSSFGFDFVISHPEWSPDGSEIAFVVGPNANNSDRQIYKVSSSGGPVQQLTSTVMNGEIGWGLDGRIAFTRGDQPASLFTINSMGGNEILLTNYPASDSSVSWHRDGTTLLFSHRIVFSSYVDAMQAVPGAPIIQLTTLGSDSDARHH